MKEIEVKTVYEGFDKEESSLIKTDQKRLQQVLLNLHSNAIKFTDRKGKIQLLVQRIKGQYNLLGPILQNNKDQIVISVIDSGIGIKESDQSKLFKLFGSIKDEKKKINTQGIGLGLVISKLIVEKFNGTIDFISQYKEGSTFFFSFEIEPY